MADTVVLRTTFQLRRGLAEEWALKNPILEEGEPGFEVDTEKLKIGNGVSHYLDLPYTNSNGGSLIQHGYYLNGEFYSDSTYTHKLIGDINILYVDKNSNGKLYTYNGTNYDDSVKLATEMQEGIMKLYNAPGANVDGTMTQKVITEGVNSIKFIVEDSDNDGESDCLVLDLPWD